MNVKPAPKIIIVLKDNLKFQILVFLVKDSNYLSIVFLVEIDKHLNLVIGRTLFFIQNF